LLITFAFSLRISVPVFVSLDADVVRGVLGLHFDFVPLWALDVSHAVRRHEPSLLKPIEVKMSKDLSLFSEFLASLLHLGHGVCVSELRKSGTWGISSRIPPSHW
jgi:hypothetical protein